MFTTLEQLQEAAKNNVGVNGKPKIGIVYPCDSLAIETACAIAEAGFAEPLLIGPKKNIEAALAQFAPTKHTFAILDTPDEPLDAASAAVESVQRGDVKVLMKGSLHTDTFMGQVLKREGGLRFARRVSHVFVFALPNYHKLIALTDCVVNIAPDVETKKEMITNALPVLSALGVAKPKIAVVSAVETVNEAIPATVDAQTLVAHAQTGVWGNAIVEGPFGFDNAFSKKAAEVKKISSEVSGDADLLLLPDLNAGNILYKSFVYVGGSECAGVIVGAKVPIVITSRADSVASRVYSLALALLTGKA